MAQLNDCSAIRILLVDDEPAFRTSVAEMLRDDGHEVCDYAMPADIPVPSKLGRIDVLITDYEMPGGNGIDLADAFHAGQPGVPVILATAYRTPALNAQVLDRTFLRLVDKPVDYAAVHRLIHDAVAATK